MSRTTISGDVVTEPTGVSGASDKTDIDVLQRDVMGVAHKRTR
jgi:hypothetical protein